MLATRLFEGVPDAVPAVSTGASPARLGYVGSHLSPGWWPALGEVPATGHGVRTRASMEAHHPGMVNPAISSFRANSYASWRPKLSAVSLRRWLLMLRSMGKPHVRCHAFVVARARIAVLTFSVVMAIQSALASEIGVTLTAGIVSKLM